MDEVAASRRRVWFALLLAATFLVALSVLLTATPSTRPLRVEAAAAATVSGGHGSSGSHRSSDTASAPLSTTSSTTASTTTSVAPHVALTRSTAQVVSHHTKAAPTPKRVAVAAPTTTVAPPTTTIPPSAAAFLACIRQRESHGNYTAVSANGMYRGAYQFTQSSWDLAANHAGRHDLVGVLPDRASPANQDAMALTLYEWMGSAPWNGACS